ncbi:MAG: nucleoside-diphosphate sugar epimerase/dehydratase [Cyanobacteria bacterium]|nr:nucleoside-diphosphate sugar epimerase/dehydratase [Cyanobacteriota bacterium]MDA1020932.1 nucleoside-diphosphate sugar epimerase/dehydratase [Cyanobacteriota bacterium]
MFKIKNIFRISIDLTLLSLAFILATVTRLEPGIISHTDQFIYEQQLWKVLPLVVIAQFLVLLAFGTYTRFWRYTSTSEIIHLSRSLLVAFVILVIPRFFGLSPKNSDLLALSYGVVVLDFFMAVAFLSGIRMLRSYLVNQRNIQKRLQHIDGKQKRTLIIGAGEAGLQAIQSIQMHPETGLIVVGVLDDDTRKHGMKLEAGVAVQGPITDLQYWVGELSVDQIIIAIPSLPLQERRKLNMLCNETGVDVRTIPSVDQLAGGQVTVDQIRKLSMEDLLGRDEVDMSGPEVHALLEGRRVLVTGAGGSIGKELCIQLAKNCNIKSICLLGKGENSIFDTWHSLGEYLDQDQIVKRIADVRNYNRIDSIFEEFKPDVVFHAAAHKHVHLMEINPCEAFENNVLGTQNIAQLSGKHAVGAFVLVSTDKAVNPTSIMGSTKSLAEKVTLMTSKEFPKTKYTAVRFGNVLGSRGSVITVWEKQLKAGLPITVTHEEAIRYFMTIPEAAQLVIQAGARAAGGEIMVLDMGEPVKIHDLAKQFIQLAGFPLDDVAIEITGLREGEKLYEELLTSDEFVDHKMTDKIYKAKIGSELNDEKLRTALLELVDIAKANDFNKTKVKIKSLMLELDNAKIAV